MVILMEQFLITQADDTGSQIKDFAFFSEGLYLLSNWERESGKRISLANVQTKGNILQANFHKFNIREIDILGINKLILKSLI